MSHGHSQGPEIPDELAQGDSEDGTDEPFVVPITDVFDLHAFRPQEVSEAVRAYLDAAFEKGLTDIRIIHGRGVGVQRQTVRTILERDSRVVEFHDADSSGGGWGATVARLRPEATSGTSD